MNPSSVSSRNLSQPEHWLRILAEASPAAIFVHRDVILFANPSALSLTGYSESELIGMPIGEVVRDASGPMASIIRRNGEVRSTRSTSALIEMAGSPATLLTAIDITENSRAEQRTREVEAELELAQRAGRWITWRWFPGSDRLEMSPHADSLLGTGTRQRVVTGKAFLNLVHADDRDRLRQSMERLLAGDEDLSLEARFLTSRGDIRWLAQSAIAHRDGGGHVHSVFGIAHDISEQKITENALFQERDRAFVTLSSIADGVIRTDGRGTVDYLNPVAQRLTGWSLADSYGRPAHEIYQIVDEATGRFLPNPVQDCLEEQREASFLGQRQLVRRDGTRLPVHDSVAPIRDRQGRLTGAILVFRDLTQMRQVEQEIRHLASHDPLTGLANRRELELILRQLFRSAAGELHHSVLCQLDLDAFKLINDTCGHTAGDQLIRQIAALLQQHSGPRDLLARLGADEFAVLFRDCPATEALPKATALCNAIHASRFHWQGRTFTPRVSAGLVPWTSAAPSPEALLGAADAACFVAKDSGGGRIHVFEPGDTTIAERYGEMQWISRIQKGLDEGRFCLWQQRINRVGGDSREPLLNELLIRMIDDEGHLVAPGSFIPAAERYGQIATLDRWVVRTALAHMASNGESSGHSRFAVNISGKSLGGDGFLEYIERTIEETGIAPCRILFEITETSAITNLPNAMRFITALKKMGCLFVLDDFGQGLSSFGYLKSLPLDFIKIDGEFVREMTTDPIQAALVSSIRDIGEVMGLKTIAESVEDEATYEALVEMGVDYVQGFYLDQPRPLTIGSPPPVTSHPGA